jgi:hypothetical protein
MYAGCESCGRIHTEKERADAAYGDVAAAGGTAPVWKAMTRDDEKLTELFGTVVPGSEQFKLQHSRAIETSGALPFSRAVSQQSIMPLIGHLPSLSCAWTPATALASMAMIRTKAVSHFAITDRKLY